MATFVLIHGAGDVGWYWHLVEDELRAQGHGVVAPDLPCDDHAAGLPEYADVVIDSIPDRGELVVVGQSFGAFTATLVAERVRADLLVLVAGMVPAPGEKPEDWFTATGWDPTERAIPRGTDGADDVPTDVFYHDVPAALAAEARRRERHQSPTPGTSPWPLTSWPAMPTRFVLCTEDRLFPPTFMRRVVAERLAIAPDEIAAGHCVALSRPEELAGMLAGYLATDRL